MRDRETLTLVYLGLSPKLVNHHTHTHTEKKKRNTIKQCAHNIRKSFYDFNPKISFLIQWHLRVNVSFFSILFWRICSSDCDWKTGICYTAFFFTLLLDLLFNETMIRVVHFNGNPNFLGNFSFFLHFVGGNSSQSGKIFEFFVWMNE